MSFQLVLNSWPMILAKYLRFVITYIISSIHKFSNFIVLYKRLNLQILETQYYHSMKIVESTSKIDGIYKIKESKFKNSKWKIVLFHLLRSTLLILPTRRRTGMINDDSRPISIPLVTEIFFHRSRDFMDLNCIIFIITIILFIDREIYFWNRW